MEVFEKLEKKKKNQKIKKYAELWGKIIGLIKSITKNSDNYDGKYMKIKLNSNDELSLNKTIIRLILSFHTISLRSDKKNRFCVMFVVYTSYLKLGKSV